METNTPSSNERFPVGTVVLGCFAGALCALLPLGLAVLPAFYAYAMMRYRPAVLGAMSAAFCAACAVLYAGKLGYAAVLVAFAGGGAVIVYVLQKRRLGNAYTAAAAAGFAVLVLYGALCLPGVLSGEGAFAFAQTRADTVIDGMRAALSAAAGSLPPDVLAVYEQYFNELSRSVSAYVVPSICMMGVLFGLSCVLFFRLFARGRVSGLAPMRPFRLWAIPREWTIGLFVLLVGSVLLDFADVDYADAVGYTVNVVAGVPLMLQGLCTIDFLIQKRCARPKLIRVLVYVGVGALFFLLQTGLMLLGCMEQVLRYRDRQRGVLPPRTPRNF